MRKRFLDDQDMKVLVVLALSEILKVMEEEIVECLDTIMEMLAEIDFNKNPKLYMLLKEAGERLRSKVLYQIETNKELTSDIISIILDCINKYFERENSNIKKWVLAWFYFLLNVDDCRIFLSLWIHLVDMINLLSKYEDEEIINITENLIQELLNKFMKYESSIAKDICFSMCEKLLDNYNEYELELKQQLLSLDWIIGSFMTGVKENGSSVDGTPAAEQVEATLVKCLKLIIDNQNITESKIKEKLNVLNNSLLHSLKHSDRLLESRKEERFGQVLDLLIARLKTADLKTIQLIIIWLDRIFELNPILFEAHVNSFVRVLDNECHSILAYTMTFTAKLINVLNHYELIERIVGFYISHKKKDSKLREFIEFIKILMPVSSDAIGVFVEIISILMRLADNIYLLKMIENFQHLYISDHSFAFLRDFIKKVKIGKLTPAENTHFLKIVELWSLNNMASFGLCIASGKYKMAYSIIVWIAQNEIKKHDIDQLHTFIMMLEAPYFAYTRIDLLKFNQ